ncbi:hypothetical protein ACHHYP_16058 [Achlya hypogyna]|uniref:PX domain-containing protein n=1 Tax=Achlya hypogyna TaxID=1202772 RepID=A0A1V9Y9K6_ACHHY|nr:hypothetical protein ACHHYP_16058 [Achlya hypogyna]
MDADLGRIAVGMQAARCRITGASICRRKQGGFRLLSSSTVVYHVKVIDRAGPIVLDWTYDDFVRLYKRLQAMDRELCAAIAMFPCPKKTFFGRRNALVIKGMCGELENHLTNVLKIGMQFAAASATLHAAIAECLE